mmetsp:Transcript_17962/g.27167  ORF Transcript_17962/g.27167 Transcript_17962/m.27167 type:complete len:94 (+) Transcript_17962:257-538(+)
MENLSGYIEDGVVALKNHRPLDIEKIQKVQNSLLLRYTHFSLHLEGNELSLDETRTIQKRVLQQDWKHEDANTNSTAELTERNGLEEALRAAP